jgi:hypothetical protein
MSSQLPLITIPLNAEATGLSYRFNMISAIRLAQILLIGYLSLGRTFAYVGIQSLRLYVGDAVLLIFLLCRPDAVLEYLMSSSSAVKELCWLYLMFLGYGLTLAMRGLSLEYPALTTFQDLVFNIYPLYFFVGLWIGRQDPSFLSRVTLPLAWCTGVYGTAYILVLSKTHALLPGTTNVPLFGQPAGCSVAILALLCFGQASSRFGVPIILNVFVMLSNQVRSEWLGFLVAIFLWSLLSRRLTRFVTAVAVLSAILVVGFALDARLPGPRGEISSRNIVGRAISPFDPEMAAEYTAYAKQYKGTTTWRQRWWTLIWNSVHERTSTALFGHAYGFPLSFLAPYIRDDSLRTPHNVFFYILGYGGWAGVILFFGFQLTILLQLWRAYLLTNQGFGISYWALMLTGSFFGNVFETPYGAIPVYFIQGLAAAPLLFSGFTAHRGWQQNARTNTVLTAV